jgi:hypothetical protein
MRPVAPDLEHIDGEPAASDGRHKVPDQTIHTAMAGGGHEYGNQWFCHRHLDAPLYFLIVS